jgi:hypothetical protein
MRKHPRRQRPTLRLGPWLQEPQQLASRPFIPGTGEGTRRQGQSQDPTDLTKKADVCDVAPSCLRHHGRWRACLVAASLTQQRPQRHSAKTHRDTLSSGSPAKRVAQRKLRCPGTKSRLPPQSWSPMTSPTADRASTPESTPQVLKVLFYLHRSTLLVPEEQQWHFCYLDSLRKSRSGATGGPTNAT